jgi:hypothetical protein
MHFARVKTACPALSSTTNISGTLRESNPTIYRFSPSIMYLRTRAGAPQRHVTMIGLLDRDLIRTERDGKMGGARPGES